MTLISVRLQVRALIDVLPTSYRGHWPYAVPSTTAGQTSYRASYWPVRPSWRSVRDRWTLGGIGMCRPAGCWSSRGVVDVPRDLPRRGTPRSSTARRAASPAKQDDDHHHTRGLLMADTSPWRLDLDTWNLIGPDRHRALSAREFDQQLWPPCLKCSTTIEVDRIPTKSLAESEPTFIIGRLRCPRGCSPWD